MRTLALSCLTLVASMSVPMEARPCGNEVYLETDEATRLLAKAEADLDGRRYSRLLDRLEYDVRMPSPALEERRATLVAVAHIRLRHLTRGVRMLRPLLARRPDDPYLRTRLAEGLSGLKKGKEEALKILSELEKSDLLPDAEGYAALARLRAKAGDKDGERTALERCQRMSDRPSSCPRPSEPQS